MRFIKHSRSIPALFETDFNLYRNFSNVTKYKKTLTLDSCSEGLKNMQYAVRGPVLAKAKQHVLDLKQGVQKPFKDVILTNVGDAQAMGQPYMTFIRQVASLCLYPQLLLKDYYPPDVHNRAVALLRSQAGCSMGSCSTNKGMDVVREHIAEYITNRDCIDEDSNPGDIILGDGASTLIKLVMYVINPVKSDGEPIGCMCPVPMYPLYSAMTTANSLYIISYYLEESNNWELNIDHMYKVVDEACEHCDPKLLVLINPGNPTGNVLTRKNIEDAVRFAHKKRLIILADEVYQDNVYKDNKFHSVRKVMYEMGKPYSEVELFSFMSASKGFAGECGFRSGYMEMINIDDEVKELLVNMSSLAKANTIGQVVMDTIINPPKKDEPSHELYMKEKKQILANLASKADTVVGLLNSVEGIQCNQLNGAMYAFPKVTLPEKFIKEAKGNKLEPNQEYCMRLLNEKGVVVIPGSGFGQLKGSYHFRTTILPPIEKLEFMVKQVKDFNEKFYKDYN